MLHRDLKPANILVMGEGPEEGMIKIGMLHDPWHHMLSMHLMREICDARVACETPLIVCGLISGLWVGSHLQLAIEALVGQRRRRDHLVSSSRAPVAIQGTSSRNAHCYRCFTMELTPSSTSSMKHYTRAVDMWAVGCIFGELFYSQALFTGKDSEVPRSIHMIRSIDRLITES